MSTAFPITIGATAYKAKPASFAFQNENKEKLKQLQAGTLAADEAQHLMAAMIIHCIKRATPDLDVAALSDDLDAVEIARASVVIGQNVQDQVAAAYGVATLGESKAG